MVAAWQFVREVIIYRSEGLMCTEETISWHVHVELVL
jgi:hypothetical protein